LKEERRERLENFMNHRILRLPEVKTSTGLSRSTIYFRMAEGTFPKQIPLGRRTVGWLEKEIQQWLERQIQTSRSSEPHQEKKQSPTTDIFVACGETGNRIVANTKQPF
jgi:prophage regulatory protein